MNILKSTTALALALGLGMGFAAAGPASAADTSEKAGAAATGQDSQKVVNEGSQASVEGIRAEELIGRNVVNRKGEDLGEVEGLVIQPQKEEVHAVVSIGGFLGIGDRDVAIPIEQLQIGTDNVTLMSQQTKEQLEVLPEYDENEWQIWQGPATVTPKEGAK